MNRSEKDKQRKFFNFTNNQYDQSLILHPPLHTHLEIQSILKKLQPVRKNRLIVEFGSGSGRITIPLLQNSFSVLAIDVSDASLRNLKKLAKKLSLTSLTTRKH